MQKRVDQPIELFKELCTLEIGSLPPTYNTIARKHWAVKANMAKRWIAVIWTHCSKHKVSGLELKQARLELTRHSWKEPDYDGLVSSFKHVIDGLVRAAVIRDDNREVIGTPIYRWEKAPRNHGKITVKILIPESPLNKFS